MQNYLRDSLEHLTQAYQLLGAPVVIVGLDGSVAFVNAACEKLFGYSNEELRGREVSKIIPSGFPGRDIQSCANAMWEGLATGVRKGGAEVPISFTVSLPVGDSDKVLGYIAVLRPSAETSVESQEAARTPELEGAARLQGMGLFEQMHAEEDAKRLAYEQSVLMEIGRIISSSLDIDEVYEQFAEQARKLIQFDRIYISLVDFEQEVLITAYTAGLEVSGRHSGVVGAWEHTIGKEACESRSGVIVQNQSVKEAQKRYPHIAPAFNAGIKSFLTVPLISNDKANGVLGLRSKQPNAYSKRDLTLAETIAAQIAGAVANADLHGKLEREANEREVLAEIGRIVSSSLDIEQIYEQFAEAARKLISFDRVIVATVDMEQQSATIAYSWGIQTATTGIGDTVSLIDIKTAHVRQVAASQSGKIFHAASREEIKERFPGLIHAYDAGIRSFLSVPLISNDQVTGVLLFRSCDPEAYDERDLSVAQQIGNQVAGAITNSVLHERVQQSQAVLELRSAELMQSNADLEQFAYVASHDLQTPLRTVAGLIRILAEDYEGRLDADGDELIRLTVSEVTRMQVLIKTLLEYSRLGQDIEELQYTDCQSLLIQELEDMAVAISEARATVTYDALPTVQGDSSLLGQLLRNLVSNAIKYRADEPPRVHVSAERAGDEWIFSVSDNGIGIEPRYTERIFVIFQRLHHQSEFSGTGMGLAICKKAIDRLGGRIWVDSRPGEGATFYFTVPIPDDSTMAPRRLNTS